MIFLKHQLVVFFFLFVCTLGVVAQQEYLFSHISTREGLASNDVIAVQQDKEGFIWIATLNGLQRYDGSRLLTFRHRADDTTTIPGNKIVFMQMDTKNRLWLLCDDNDVGYFNTIDFTFHPVQVAAGTSAIKRAEGHLFIDEEGNIFLRLSGQSLLQFDETTNAFSTDNALFSLPSKWHAVWLYLDQQQHNYWIACDSGLVKFNPKTKALSYRNHNSDNDVVINQYAALTHTSYPYLDSKGRFWIVSWPPSGLSVYSFNLYTKQQERREVALGKLLRYVYYEIDGIQELKDSTLWFTGYNLLATFNNKENNFRIFKNDLPGEYSIHYDMVYQLYEDLEKNIWVCTNTGLYRFNPSAQLFRTISLKRPGKDSFYTPDVADIMQTKTGDILVSTWGSGIFSYDSSLEPKHLLYVDESFKKNNLFTWCTHQRANGDIWSGHQSGTLFIIHANTKQPIDKLQLPVFENSTIRQIAEDKTGNLWLGTQKGLLIKWDATSNTFTLVQRLQSIVYRLYIDRQGNVWACTQKNGVYKINVSDGSIALHYTAEGDAARRLMGVGADDIVQYDDSLYIIASGGLNILNIKTNTIRYFNVNSDIFSNTVSNIVVDKQGLLWVTTQSGLFSINLKNKAVVHYEESDGLQNNFFNPASATVLNDGRIALGTSHNFIVFNPGEIMQTGAVPPSVKITGFTLMNEALSLDSLAKQKAIVLPYSQNSITIAFSTLHYQNSYGILYMLEGLDKEWVSAKNNEAIYSYLPPGTYTFKIKAVNANNTFSNEVTTLSIVVQAPFWKTWWFYSLLLLAGIAFLYWLDRERMKRKAVLQNMRSNISGSLHEEINNALQNINVLSEIARIKADKEPEQSKNYIDEIHHKCNSLIEAMDDMLWSIDPANDTMAHTISRMKEIAHTISYRYNTAIQVHNDDKVIQLKPDMRRRHELMIIYKMALQLLAAQMRARTILVELSFIKSHVQLNMFAAGVKLNSNNTVQETIRSLKAKTATLKSSLEVQADDKGVGIILLVKR